MHIWQILYVIAPLVAAGVVHAVVIHRDLVPRLARPIDGGRMLYDRPIFGSTKTWRGVIVMIVATMAATGAQRLLEHVDAIGHFAPLHASGWAILGFSMALGYILGELPNSFVKRRLGIAPGARSRTASAIQYVIDQADSAVAVAIVLGFFSEVSASDVVAIAVAGTGVHALFDLVRRRVSRSRDIRRSGQPARTG